METTKDKISETFLSEISFVAKKIIELDKLQTASLEKDKLKIRLDTLYNFWKNY